MSATWPGPRWLARHGRAGSGGSGACKVPPLLNHFRLPSSHEKYKPARGCHGAGLGCGSPQQIPSANTFANRGPASTSCPRLLLPQLLGGGEGVQVWSQRSLISGDSPFPAEPGPPPVLESPTGRLGSECLAGTVPLAPVTPPPQGHGQAEGAVSLVAFALQAPGGKGTGCPHTPPPLQLDG